MIKIEALSPGSLCRNSKQQRKAFISVFACDSSSTPNNPFRRKALESGYLAFCRFCSRLVFSLPCVDVDSEATAAETYSRKLQVFRSPPDWCFGLVVCGSEPMRKSQRANGKPEDNNTHTHISQCACLNGETRQTGNHIALLVCTTISISSICSSSLGAKKTLQKTTPISGSARFPLKSTGANEQMGRSQLAF